jgi:His/Glu/Gln/Arg/opine family amino acid ABC transporter permease subunit
MPDVIVKNLPFLLHGLTLTLDLSVWSIMLGTLLGLVVGTVRFVRLPLLNTLALVYVEFVRGTPLLVVLFITYFALPALLGYRTTGYRAAIFGFVLFIGAYLAEDFRSGLRAVRPTLIQAGLATGLTRWQVHPAAGHSPRAAVAVQPVCATHQVHIRRLSDRRHRTDRRGPPRQRARIPPGHDFGGDRHRLPGRMFRAVAGGPRALRAFRREDVKRI